jgi:hypothetical protein
MKLLAVLIEDYEQKRYSMGDASPLDRGTERVNARERDAGQRSLAGFWLKRNHVRGSQPEARYQQGNGQKTGRDISCFAGGLYLVAPPPTGSSAPRSRNEFFGACA